MNHSPHNYPDQKYIKELFREKLGDNIVTDGIVNPDQWKKTNPKIVFVLKETNEQETSLTDLLNDPFSGKYRIEIEDKNKRNGQIVRDLRATWFNIARWALGINSLANTTVKPVPWKNISSKSNWYKKDWLEELKNIAVINIKKTVGKEKSEDSELRGAVVDYGNLTWDQINKTRPNIVIFCGVGWIFDTYYLKEKQSTIKWKETKTGFLYFENNNTVYIQFWHPNAHFPHNMMFYALMDIVKELQKNYKIWENLLNINNP